MPIIPRKNYLNTYSNCVVNQEHADFKYPIEFDPAGRFCAYNQAESRELCVFEVYKSQDTKKYPYPMEISPSSVIYDACWGYHGELAVIFAENQGGYNGYSSDSMTLWTLNTQNGEWNKIASSSKERYIRLEGFSKEHPNKLVYLISHNNDLFEIYLYDLTNSRHKKLDYFTLKSGNAYEMKILLDDNFALKYVYHALISCKEINEKLIRVYFNEEGLLTPIFTADSDDFSSVQILNISPDYLYWVDGRNKKLEFPVVKRMDLNTYDTELVISLRSEITDVIFDKKEQPIAAVTNKDKFSIQAIGDSPVARALVAVVEEIEHLQLPDTFGSSEDLQVIAVPSTKNPFDMRVLHLEDGTYQEVDGFSIEPPRMHPWQHRAKMTSGVVDFEGFPITYYLIEPHDTTNSPVLVDVHGGPLARDENRIDPFAEILANRGITTLKINFLGSSGFGNSFTKAGFGQWGSNGKILESIMHVIHNLQEGGAIGSRLAINGYSFGAHIAFAAGAKYPQFQAIIAGAGDVELTKTLEHVTDPTSRRFWESLIGAKKENVEFLRSCSPLYSANEFKAPVLIISPDQDKVVDYEQTRLMAEALEKAGKRVTEVKMSGEDHFFSPESEEIRVALIETFLAQVFGTPRESIGDLLRRNSNFKVERGIQYIPEIEKAFHFSSPETRLIPSVVDRHLQAMISPENTMQLMEQLQRSSAGRRLVEELCADAFKSGLFSSLVWCKNSDGTFRPTQIRVPRGFTNEMFRDFVVRFVTSSEQHSATLLGVTNPNKSQIGSWLISYNANKQQPMIAGMKVTAKYPRLTK